jgi:hypothetical protein
MDEAVVPMHEYRRVTFSVQEIDHRPSMKVHGHVAISAL